MTCRPLTCVVFFAFDLSTNFHWRRRQELEERVAKLEQSLGGGGGGGGGAADEVRNSPAPPHPPTPPHPTPPHPARPPARLSAFLTGNVAYFTLIYIILYHMYIICM